MTAPTPSPTVSIPEHTAPRRSGARSRTLVVVCHPRPDSLTRQAFERVLRGLERRGDTVRVIDLDALAFDPSPPPSTAAQDDDVADHRQALAWADGLVFVYPTWFSGQPARLKGWFDRVLTADLVPQPPSRPWRRHGRLGHVRRLDLVTSHGSSRLVNVIQAESGQRMIFRSLRTACGLRCRTRRTTLYSLDRRSDQDVADWLDEVETRFSR